MKHGIALACLVIACGPPPRPPQPRPVVEQPAPETRPATAAIEVPPPEPEPPPPPPPPPPDRIVRILVVSAEHTATMTNGEEWDAKGAPPPSGVPAPILRHLEQHPELADTWAMMGVPIDDAKLIDAAARSPAPDPMVIVEIGATVFRTPVRPRQFNPVWDFPISFLYGSSGERTGVPIGAMARFQVVDYDGPNGFDSMGATLVPVADLLEGNSLRTFGPFGNVRKLMVVVTSQPVPAPEPPPLQHRLAVSGNAQWTDTGIDVIAGQRIDVEAADEVCSKGGSLDHCSGPEGQRRTSGYNVDGFAKLGHGALIGTLGDTRFPVRRSLSMVAPSSGRLRLGINDSDTGDNRGSYAVRVTIHALP